MKNQKINEWSKIKNIKANIDQTEPNLSYETSYSIWWIKWSILNLNYFSYSKSKKEWSNDDWCHDVK